MIVCHWGHWRLLVWPYFAHFTKKWGETPKTRENSGISCRSKPVGFCWGGLLGWGTTSQNNLAFPYAMVTMVIQSLVANAIGYIVNQLIWQFTSQILAKTTNRWGRKSLQKIRQHHQIGEEKKSTGSNNFCAVLDSWKRRWILEIQGFFQVPYSLEVYPRA